MCLQGPGGLANEDIDSVLAWNGTLAASLPTRHGVFPRRLANSPTVAATFKHRRSEMASIRENNAWLALGKVGCV